MPLYACSVCGCFDNTATGGYWMQEMHHLAAKKPVRDFKPLCSEHNPNIGRWHGEWPKQRADGWLTCGDGRFIYSPKEIEKFKHLGPFRPIELPPPLPE